MAENKLKDEIKYKPENKPSKDKAKYHCRHLTDKEIERIKSNCLNDKDEKFEIYDRNKLKQCLKSIILCGIINIEGYNTKDIDYEDKILNFLLLNKRLLDIDIWQGDRYFYSGSNEINFALSNIIVPGYEETQVVQDVQEDLKK